MYTYPHTHVYPHKPPNYKEIKTEATEGLAKTVILNTEEFLEKVKEGDTFFCITSWCGKPNGIGKVILKKRLPKIDTKERAVIEYWDGKTSRTKEVFIDNFFKYHKMVVLDKREAFLIFENLLERFNRDVSWTLFARSAQQTMENKVYEFKNKNSKRGETNGKNLHIRS
jgi:hypothetical protein